VRIRDAQPRVDVQDRGPGLDLRAGVRLNAFEIACQHLGGQRLAAGGVDALTDDGKRMIRADDGFDARLRAKDSLHERFTPGEWCGGSTTS